MPSGNFEVLRRFEGSKISTSKTLCKERRPSRHLPMKVASQGPLVLLWCAGLSWLNLNLQLPRTFCLWHQACCSQITQLSASRPKDWKFVARAFNLLMVYGGEDPSKRPQSRSQSTQASQCEQFHWALDHSTSPRRRISVLNWSLSSLGHTFKPAVQSFCFVQLQCWGPRALCGRINAAINEGVQPTQC
eukprot:symbB.v1.2.013961.t1/scaffold895.1/size184301/12